MILIRNLVVFYVIMSDKLSKRGILMLEDERVMSEVFTASGYRYDETISALQKTIRRGDEVSAMYWAIELEREFHNELWNRLEVISHEDIGITSMDVIMFVRTCKTQYLEFHNRGCLLYTSTSQRD